MITSEELGPRWTTPDWSAPVRVHAVSTLRTGGVSVAAFRSLNLGSHVGDAPAAVGENRRRLRAAVPLPAEPCWLEQVHGARVADLDRGDGGARDAAVTRTVGRVCAILTADCLPVLFAAADGSTVAAAHAGWRGLAAGVLRATVAALGTDPTRLLAWIGPAIGAAHYEVGDEVRAAMLSMDAGAGTAFRRNARGRYFADLPLLARRQLQIAGIGSVSGGDFCTYAEPGRYFSHRRDGPTGRQATLIWLEPA
jgi:YfiH family protein